MLIACPHCGPRDLAEFDYQGDAARKRPSLAETDIGTWHDYVYNRENPAGRHLEYWQHSGGCRAHLLIERDTTTHAIHSVRFARAAMKAVHKP